MAKRLSDWERLDRRIDREVAQVKRQRRKKEKKEESRSRRQKASRETRERRISKEEDRRRARERQKMRRSGVHPQDQHRSNITSFQTNESIKLNFTTLAWRRATWTKGLIRLSMLLTFPAAFVLYPFHHSPEYFIITLVFGLIVYPNVTKGLLWLAFIRPEAEIEQTNYENQIFRLNESKRIAHENEKFSHSLSFPPQFIESKFRDMRAISDVRMGLDQMKPTISLSPGEFEIEVAWVFKTLSARPIDTEVIGGSGDGGIDVKIYDKQHVLIGIIQAKRHNPDKALPPSYIRELESCKRRYNARKAFLVTTSRFAPAVHKEAAEMGIDLVDGERFENWRRQAHLKLAQGTATKGD